MNCAKVLFNCLEKNFRFKNSTSIGNYLEFVAFSHKSAKVKPYSTNQIMEDNDDDDILKNLNGMKILDKNAFNRTITVPCLVVNCSIVKNVLKDVKNYLLKKYCLKSVMVAENDHTRILLDPKKLKSWNDFDENALEALISKNINENNFSEVSVHLTYDNFNASTLLKAVLPKDEPPLSSFSIIGHIIHLNIKEHLLDYRHVIGEILLDKVALAKTVVYKKHFIDNVYRNFELEVLCGEHNFLTTVKENGCTFKLDFSKVYWNPRLGSEHQRIVDLLKENDVLFDLFAGIGPFAIPSAKKKCFVHANDLNPESVKWLQHNISLNKKAKDYIKVYNKDGKDFILEDFKENIIKIWADEFNDSIHVVMNLPMIAPTFIKYFKGLINDTDLINLDVKKIKKCLPIIHCYYFVKKDGEVEDKKGVFMDVSGMNLNEIEHSFHFVRKVSGSASMFRITFGLPFEYLVNNDENDRVEPLPKRICLE